MEQLVSDQIAKIRKMVAEKDISYIDAEKAVMGIDHAELGAILLRKWSVPESIVGIIERHHDENITVVNDSETAVVQAADAMCSMIGVGTGADGMGYRLSQDVARNLMPEEKVESLIGKVLVTKDHILSRFSSD
jgi:hypothetical protein